MREQVGRVDLSLRDKAYFHFALAQGFEVNGEYDEAFFHLEKGNRIKNDQSQYQFHQKTVDQAYKILNSIIDRAEDIRNLTNQGIDAIINGYMDVNRVCLPLGHYRIEEGSEHYLFYELEARTGKAYVHGHIIGLGIYIMSHLQKNKHEIITNVMDRMGLKYQPKNMGIKLQTLIESLENLRKYVCEREDLWYTVIDKETITSEWIDYIINKLDF